MLLGEIDWQPVINTMWAHSPFLGTGITIIIAFLTYLKKERNTTVNTRARTLAVYIAEVNRLTQEYSSQMQHEQHEHRMAVAALCDKFGVMHAANMDVMSKNATMLAILQGQNERIIIALENLNGHSKQNPTLCLPPDVPS